MSRCQHRSDGVPQRSIKPQLWCFNLFLALAFLLPLNAPAQAGSASATLQVTARVVSSCRISTTALHSIANTTHGRFNCPTNSDSSSSTNLVGRNSTANYTVTDVPDSDGNVKLLTLTF